MTKIEPLHVTKKRNAIILSFMKVGFSWDLSIRKNGYCQYKVQSIVSQFKKPCFFFGKKVLQNIRRVL